MSLKTRVVVQNVWILHYRTLNPEWYWEELELCAIPLT